MTLRNELHLAKVGICLFLAAFVSPPITRASDRIEKVFPVLKSPTLMLTNYSGSIMVKSWQNAEIKALCTKYSQNVEVDSESVGNKIHLSTHVLDKLAIEEKAKVDYQIFAPEESNLEIRTNLGNVVIDRIRGEVRIDVMAAPVRVFQIEGYLDARSLNSKMEIIDSKGIIRATTVSGDIILSRLSSNNITAQSTLGNISYEGDFSSGGKYNFSTNEGVISVFCSDRASVEWEARTVKGGIETNLPIKSKSHYPVSRSYFGKQSLMGTSNSGEATVQLSTFSGRIRIIRK
ncbi:MAG TPA: DUF4097 family beta strand repeat-containing protein [Terriglobia bacterium]|nr:DUF4097 family beta strand repeat-containing protein [Terriglobia bacterium]